MGRAPRLWFLPAPPQSGRTSPKASFFAPPASFKKRCLSSVLLMETPDAQLLSHAGLLVATMGRRAAQHVMLVHPDGSRPYPAGHLFCLLEVARPYGGS